MCIRGMVSIVDVLYSMLSGSGHADGMGVSLES